MLDWCLRQSTSHRVSVVYHSYGGDHSKQSNFFWFPWESLRIGPPAIWMAESPLMLLWNKRRMIRRMLTERGWGDAFPLVVYNVQVTLLEWGSRSHSRNSWKAWSIQSVFCVFLQGFFIKVWRGPMTFSGKQLALPVCGGVTGLSTNAWCEPVNDSNDCWAGEKIALAVHFTLVVSILNLEAWAKTLSPQKWDG